MTRKEVYEVIDSEREYQIRAVADKNRPDIIEDLHVGDTIAAIWVNLDKALFEWYSGAVPHQAAMGYIRKVAALSVQIMEKYGAPKREL